MKVITGLLSAPSLPGCQPLRPLETGSSHPSDVASMLCALLVPPSGPGAGGGQTACFAPQVHPGKLKAKQTFVQCT